MIKFPWSKSKLVPAPELLIHPSKNNAELLARVFEAIDTCEQRALAALEENKDTTCVADLSSIIKKARFLFDDNTYRNIEIAETNMLRRIVEARLNYDLARFQTGTYTQTSKEEYEQNRNYKNQVLQNALYNSFTGANIK